MDNQEFERRIQQRRDRWMRRGRYPNDKAHIWSGLFLLIIGGLFLAKAAGIAFPGWFFSWPVLLIGLGLFSGIKHRFRRVGWLIPIVIGAIFLADNLSDDVNLKPYLWPAFVIGAGLFIIFRPKSHRCRRGEGRDDNNFTGENITNREIVVTEGENVNSSNDWRSGISHGTDTIDATAIFGGVKKNVLSKAFKGGDVTTFMGGAEINLTQADLKDRAVIDCFNMFGGTKLIIPPDWEVQSDIMAIFGGVDDKRPPASASSTGKVLYLDGTCLFGGLEIKSY